MSNNININLTFLRNNHCLNRNQLAKEINLHESIIRKIETGVSKNPRIDTILKLSNYFDISLDDFVCKDLTKNNLTWTSSPRGKRKTK